MSGWSQLGAVLGGGPQLRQQAYQLGMETGARQADLLEQARTRRDQNLGLQAITPDAITAAQTDPDAAASLVSAMFHAKLDPRQLSGYQKDQQGIGFRNDAMAAAQDPSVSLDSLNRRMLVIGGKPVDLTHVADGVAYNPMVDPHSQTIDPTQVGLAEIMLRGAQAAQANAGAREHDAQARLADTKTAAGGFAPDHGETKPTLPPISALGATLGQGYDKATGLVTIPPEKMQQFLAWQAGKAKDDPRYNNGAFALQHYASEAPIGSGVHDSPEDIGADSLGDLMGVAAAKPHPGSQSAPAPAAASTQTAPAADAPKQPATQAEFDALPKGSLFINPADGRLMRKK
jgi:hypothetical protein